MAGVTGVPVCQVPDVVVDVWYQCNDVGPPPVDTVCILMLRSFTPLLFAHTPSPAPARKLLTYSPQRVLVNAQVLSSLLFLTNPQAAAMLSKAPALLQYNSETLAIKSLELAPRFAAAQQQLQQGLGLQALHVPGRAPTAAPDPQPLVAQQAAEVGTQPEGEATGMEPAKRMCVLGS